MLVVRFDFVGFAVGGGWADVARSDVSERKCASLFYSVGFIPS